MKNVPLSLAVVGPGLVGTKHIQLIRAHPEARLSAIVAPDHEHNHVKAAGYQVPLYSTIEALLAHENIDGILIASPSNFHVEQAMLCVDAGIPVLVEKPVATSYQDGLRLLNRAEQKNAIVIVGHHRAHSPIMRTAREIIDRKALGDIVTIMGSALFYKPDDYFKAGPWRTQIGGGPILINLIHEIGNFRALCGEIASVHAMASSAMRGYAVEDSAVIQFTFKNGALGTFILSDTAVSSKSWEHTSGENPDFPYYPDQDCYTVSGTRGCLFIPTMRLQTFAPGQAVSWLSRTETEIIPYVREDPLAVQLEHFIRVIKGIEAPLVTAYEGLQNVRIIEAIQESIVSQKTVHV